MIDRVAVDRIEYGHGLRCRYNVRVRSRTNVLVTATVQYQILTCMVALMLSPELKKKPVILLLYSKREYRQKDSRVLGEVSSRNCNDVVCKHGMWEKQGTCDAAGTQIVSTG